MFDRDFISNITPKQLISLLLSVIGLVSPLCYMPYGGRAEFYCLGVILITLLVSVSGLYLGRTLVQSSRERLGQIALDSIFQPCLWGAWIAALSASVTLIPLPVWCLELIAPYNAQVWSEAQTLLNNADTYQKFNSLFTLSVSPAHTLHWLVLHVAWISLVYLSITTIGQRKLLLWVLVALSPAISLVGVAHWLSDCTTIYNIFSILDRQQLQGFVTPLVNPNHSASLLMFSGLLSLGLHQHISLMDLDQRGKLWCFASFVLSVVGLAFTSSRAAWLIYGFCLALWWARKKLEWLIFKRILFVGCVFIFAIVPVFIAYLSMTPSYSESLTKGKIWLDSFRLMINCLPMGIGADSFGEVFTRYQTFDHLGWVSHPENLFLQRWIEGGILGFLSMIAYAWSWSRWWQNASIQRHPIALSLGLGVTAIVLQQQYDFGVERLNVFIILALAWGLMWSYLPKDIDNKVNEFRKRKSRMSRWNRCIINLVCLTLTFSLLMLVFGANPVSMRHIVHRYDRDQDQVALLESFKDHPTSAHITVRLSGLGLRNQQDWLTYTHRIAPRWGTPLIMQARALNAAGEDRIAAITYRQVLSGHPELRDLVFSDLFKSPLDVSPGSWLPSQFIYSFYTQYRSIDIDRANQVLANIDRTIVFKDSSIRSLYLRYVLPSCDQDILYKNFISGLPTVQQRLDSQSLNDLLLTIDLLTIQHGLKLCNGYTSTTTLDQLYQKQNWDDVNEPLQDEIKKRQKLGIFSLSKILKTRNFTD